VGSIRPESELARLVGATIAGKYKVEKVIGSGAMGVVCSARHVEIGKRVAIKLIESSIAGNADVARRFRREARAASIVESDHIVQVFDVGEDPNLGLYMVMEYLTGEDLSARLARETMLDVDTSVKIAYQVSRALSKAHAAGVIHRDLKPANVFLVAKEDKSIFVKVLDFGISKMLGSESLAKSGQLELTRAGSAIGTPQYASPEQAQGFLDADHRTDIWSLGVMLYEMLAGQPAYRETPTYEQFIIQLVTTQPEPLSKVAPWVPPALAAVVHAAVRHNPNERIPDCDAFGRLILQAAPKLASQRGPMRSFPDLAPPPPPPPRPAPMKPSPPIARAPRPRASSTADDTIQMAPLEDNIEAPPASATSLMDSSPDRFSAAPISDLVPSSRDSKTTVDASPYLPTPPAAMSTHDVARAASVSATSAAARISASQTTASRILPPSHFAHPFARSPWVAVGILVGIVLVGVLVGLAIVLLRSKGSV
jgi:serine/threonine protein kinase